MRVLNNVCIPIQRLLPSSSGRAPDLSPNIDFTPRFAGEVNLGERSQPIPTDVGMGCG